MPADPASGCLLDAYIREVNNSAPLSVDDESHLVSLLQGRHRATAVHSLVLAQLRTVVDIARDYLKFEQPLSDLIEEGNVGLVEAVTQFSPATREHLRSFAVRRINTRIGEFVVNNWNIASTDITQEQRRLFVRTRMFRSGSGRMTAVEIRSAATHLRIGKEVIERLEEVLGGGWLSFSAGRQCVRHHQMFDGRDAADNDGILGFDEAQWVERMEIIARHALLDLDDRTREIIRRRWLDGERKTRLQDLACEYSISTERIRQIQAQAFDSIRHAIA